MSQSGKAHERAGSRNISRINGTQWTDFWKYFIPLFIAEIGGAAVYNPYSGSSNNKGLSMITPTRRQQSKQLLELLELVMNILLMMTPN